MFLLLFFLCVWGWFTQRTRRTERPAEERMGAEEPGDPAGQGAVSGEYAALWGALQGERRSVRPF